MAITASSQLKSSYGTLTKELTQWEQATANCKQDLTWSTVSSTNVLQTPNSLGPDYTALVNNLQTNF